MVQSGSFYSTHLTGPHSVNQFTEFLTGFLTLGEPHHTENPVQLIMVVGTARLHILLATVEDGLKCQQLSKYAPNSPDIWGEKCTQVKSA